ncbi:hypothetical protein J6590_014356 [Homalodisca vitripennis]|nr:hypothetical protein J6590_014356 [Homalodisca vitripennis]
MNVEHQFLNEILLEDGFQDGARKRRLQVFEAIKENIRWFFVECELWLQDAKAAANDESCYSKCNCSVQIKVILDELTKKTNPEDYPTNLAVDPGHRSGPSVNNDSQQSFASVVKRTDNQPHKADKGTWQQRQGKRSASNNSRPRPTVNKPTVDRRRTNFITGTLEKDQQLLIALVTEECSWPSLPEEYCSPQQV